LGFCCCCIGVYFAEAIGLFALIAAYKQLQGNLVAIAQEPSEYQREE